MKEEKDRISKGIISEVTHMGGDYYTVKIQPEEKLNWSAGEHAVFTLSEAKFKAKRWRPFSVASLPEEGYILLGFRTGPTPSPFKKYVIEKGVGKKVKIKGPYGIFKLKEDDRPIVLFASGVGITPIFSMLKALRKDNIREVAVVYSATGLFLFKEEIEQIAAENSKIKVFYTQGIEQTQEKITLLAKQYGNGAYYYNSGAPFVVDSTRNLLTAQGIERKNMIDDYFVGYKF